MSEKALLDFVTEAGPKTLTPLVSASVRLELARLNKQGMYQVFFDDLKKQGQEQAAQWLRDVARISYENANADFKASDGMGIPYARFPVGTDLIINGLYGEGAWPDKDLLEAILKEHPGLRCKVKYGTRGQEYVR